MSTRPVRRALSLLLAPLLAVGVLAGPLSVDEPAAAATPVSTLYKGQALHRGDQLKSADGSHRLVLRDDDEVAVYEGKRVIWTAGTVGHWTDRLIMQADGNLVAYMGRYPLWSSRTYATGSYKAVMENDGSLVVYDGLRATWSSKIGFLGDRMRAGLSLAAGHQLVTESHSYRLAMQTDGNVVVYHGTRAVWSSGTRGKGGVRLALQADGNLVLYTAKNVAVWSTHTFGTLSTRMVMQTDGNFVLYDGDRPTWSSRNGYVGDRLNEGASITLGHQLVSKDHMSRVVLQKDGRFAVYLGSQIRWYTPTDGRSVQRVLVEGGELILNHEEKVEGGYNIDLVWASMTHGSGATYLQVRDEGYIVLYRGTDPAWIRG